MDDSLYEKLINASFRFVSFRPRSEAEIRAFLHKKMRRWKVAGQETLTRVIERLRQLDYLDDRKFVAWWIAQRSRFKPKGKLLLKAELRQKGVDPETIAAVMDLENPTPTHALEATSPGGEMINARNALRKKLPAWGKLSLLARKKKIYDFLSRRGFASQTIFHIIDELKGKDYNTGTSRGRMPQEDVSFPRPGHED